MTSHRLEGALLLGMIVSGIAACGHSSSPTSPSSNAAVVAIEGFTATVEAITTPGTGWLYRLDYHAHETGGKTGATLTATHIALSSGLNADGDFSGPGVLSVPRAPAGGAIAAETSLSVLTTAPAASHVTFTLTYTDDNGHPGSVTAEADISPKP